MSRPVTTFPARSLIAALALTLLAGLRAGSAQDAAPQDAAVGDGPVLEGLIEPSDVVEVSSRTAGLLQAVLVERGTRVRAGQAVAQLHAELERLAVEQSEARLRFSRRRAARNEELYRKDLMSLHERDELETQIEVEKLQLAEARERLQMRTVKSPVDGVVVQRHFSAGEYVGRDAIVEVVQLDPLYVEVVAPAELLGRITPGMRAEIRVETPLELRREAVVTIVDPVVDAASSTFGARLELANPDYELPPGLACTVTFHRD